MTAKFVRKNSNTSVELEYEELSPMPEQTIKDMAYELWERGLGDHDLEVDTGELDEDGEGIFRPIVFDDLEEQDHLDIWDAYLKRVTLDMAAAGVRRQENAVAKAEADKLVQARHGLGE